MGAIAEGFVAYAQPLLDQTDGSEEQLNKAFAISQLCFNLALLPEDSRDTTLSEMRPALKMDDEEFDAFRRSIVVPDDPATPGDVPANAPAGFHGPFAKRPLAAGAPENGGARRNVPWNRPLRTVSV